MLSAFHYETLAWATKTAFSRELRGATPIPTGSFIYCESGAISMEGKAVVTVRSFRSWDAVADKWLDSFSKAHEEPRCHRR
jgi:hypothetical protein